MDGEAPTRHEGKGARQQCLDGGCADKRGPAVTRQKGGGEVSGGAVKAMAQWLTQAEAVNATVASGP
jgi:hypothetical protein